MFQGSIVAIVTPMQEGDTIDVGALQELIEWHIANKTDGIVVGGTTGESATLTEAELMHIIRLCVDQVQGRIPVIAGTFSNSTTKAIALTRSAMELGVDACLIMTPAYIKPTQEGLYQHFSAIAKAVPIPIITYNVPSRTVCDMLPETVARLAQHSNIIGIKEATGKVERAKEILALCGDRIDIYSGDDATAMELILAGAKGVISVTANVVPALMHQLCQAAIARSVEQARAINDKISALHQQLFVEANPIPVKWALSRMHKIKPFIRMPLTWFSLSQQTQLEKTLLDAGIL